MLEPVHFQEVFWFKHQQTPSFRISSHEKSSVHPISTSKTWQSSPKKASSSRCLPGVLISCLYPAPGSFAKSSAASGSGPSESGVPRHVLQCDFRRAARCAPSAARRRHLPDASLGQRPGGLSSVTRVVKIGKVTWKASGEGEAHDKFHTQGSWVVLEEWSLYTTVACSEYYSTTSHQAFFQYDFGTLRNDKEQPFDTVWCVKLYGSHAAWASRCSWHPQSFVGGPGM